MYHTHHAPAVSKSNINKLRHAGIKFAVFNYMLFQYLFLLCTLPTCHQQSLKSLFCIATTPWLLLPASSPALPIPIPIRNVLLFSSYQWRGPTGVRPCSHVLCTDHSSPPAGKSSQNLWNTVIKPAQSTQSFLSRPSSDTPKYTCSRDSLKYGYENILKCTNPRILSKSHFGKKTNKQTISFCWNFPWSRIPAKL